MSEAVNPVAADADASTEAAHNVAVKADTSAVADVAHPVAVKAGAAVKADTSAIADVAHPVAVKAGASAETELTVDEERLLICLLGKLSLEEVNLLSRVPRSRIADCVKDRKSIPAKSLFGSIRPNGFGYYSYINFTAPNQVSLKALSALSADKYEEVIDSYWTDLNTIISFVNRIVDHVSTKLFCIGKTYGDANKLYKGLQSRLGKYKMYNMDRFIVLGFYYDEDMCLDQEKLLLGRYEFHSKLHPVYNTRGRVPTRDHDCWIVYLVLHAVDPK